jgi:hypothetical protein
MKPMKHIALLLLPFLAFAAGAAGGGLLGVSKELCNWTVFGALALFVIADYTWLSVSGVPPAAVGSYWTD